MTIISRISVKAHCNDLGGKVWNPALRWTLKYAVFVEIEDEDGQIGVGECWCFDAKPDALIAFLRTEVVPYFLGEHLNDVEEITHRRLKFATLSARHGILVSALSGIDIATWDLRAQKNKEPVWKTLNPRGSGRALFYASGGLYGEDKDEQALITEMTKFSQSGFSISKMKIGALDVADDIARINAVIAALPDSARLIIDCVYSYSYDDIARIYEQLPAYRIEAVQSPVAADNFHAMTKLVENGVPVMANEAEYRSELHTELVERRAIRFLQSAPIACGGVSRIRRLSTLTKDTPISISLEVSSTAIALTAASHLAAADSSIAHVEYHSIHDVFFDALPLRRQAEKEGLFTMSEVPGLGICLPDQGLIVGFEARHE